MIKSLTHLRLAWDLAKRDLAAKYRRSTFGVFWLILTPLILLSIYTLIFGYVFGVEWTIPRYSNKNVGFVLPFFVGLTIYLIFTDIVNSSTTLFASKRTYVIKSPFPLWVLIASNLMRVSIHGLISLILLILLALFQQHLTLIGLLWMILVLIVIVTFMAAVSLILASLSPFIGDISEIMRLLLRIFFYITPITYPLSMIPEKYHILMWINPLTCIVEFLRNPIVFGIAPNISILIGFSLGTIILLIMGYWVFSRVKGVISDVV